MATKTLRVEYRYSYSYGEFGPGIGRLIAVSGLGGAWVPCVCELKMISGAGTTGATVELVRLVRPVRTFVRLW